MARSFFLMAGVLVAALGAAPARLADDMNIQRLATCQDSWLDWKDDPVQMDKLASSFRSTFEQKPGDAFFVPRKSVTVAGLRVQRAFPESIGMAVGFSVLVDATFDQTRKAVEKAVGKSLKDCDTSDGMRTCSLEVGEKKTIALMSGDKAKSTPTLVGCYYYYPK